MNHVGESSSQNRRSLLFVLTLTTIYLIIEVGAGLWTHSLALLADAVHMFTDVGSLALAAFAAWMAQKPATPERSYGYYRIEILAALANAMLLLFSAFYILYEAYQRLQTPSPVTGLPMLIVAAIGLGVNLLSIWLLRHGSKENLNMQGAFYEVIKDALGSVGAIIAGLIIVTTGWTYADTIASALIALFILPRTWQLLSEAVAILLEATPAQIDATAVEQSIRQLEYVGAVHDLHIWTVTSGFVALSAHVVLAAHATPAQAQSVLEQLNQMLKATFQVEHTTIQVESQDLQAKEPEP